MSEELSIDQTVVVQRAANEGVPVGAIARIVQRSFHAVHEALKDAISLGRISVIPRADWAPAVKWAERAPTIPRAMNIDDVEFHCKRVFKLTNLEVGFMMVLLRADCADKEKLHGVIESQRFKRYARPDEAITDPKMVDVMICKLRKKLKAVDIAVTITTSWGKGYYFEPPIKERVYQLIGGHHASQPQAGRGSHSLHA